MAEAKPAPKNEETPAKAAGPATKDGIETITTTKGERSFTGDKLLGKDLDHMVDLHGADAVFSHALSHMRISLQGKLRRMMESEDPVYTEKDLQKANDEWKAGVKIIRAKSDADKVRDLLANMDPAIAAALLAEQAK